MLQIIEQLLEKCARFVNNPFTARAWSNYRTDEVWSTRETGWSI